MSFAFPKCWSDDQTMNFRFQPFRDKNSNPVAYDAKMKFWKELILDVSQSSLLTDSTDVPLSITHDMLCKVLTRKGKTPKCLSTVLEELQRDGLLTEYQAYEANLLEVVQRQRASWTSWSYQVIVSSPLKKLANKVVSAVSPRATSIDSTHYIIHRNVKQAAQNLLQAIRQRADNSSIGADYRLVLSRRSISSISQVDTQKLDLLLLWLESEKCMISASSDTCGTVYKFSRADGVKLQSLTEVEQGVIQIQHTRDKLEASISNRQHRVEQCIANIKSMLANKNRTLALRYLRQKKVIEKSIDKEAEYLHRLDCTLDEIYMSATTQLVLQAYGKGAATLNSLNDLTPVSAVNSTMDSLSDSLATSEEITAAMSSPLSTDDADAESLDRELADLLAAGGVDDLVGSVDRLVVADDAVGPKKKAASPAKVLAS